MEKPLLKFMRENFLFFGGLSALYGIIFAFCIYRNTHGITFPFYTIATLLVVALFMKKIGFVVKKGTAIYIIGMLLLSVAMTYTVSFFFLAFNWIGILLLFMMAMIHQFYDDSKWGFLSYLTRLLLAIGTAIAYFFYPFKHGFNFLSEKDNSKKKSIVGLFIGILIALALLTVILPLLLRSDMMFAKIFGEILQYINFRTIFGVLLMMALGFTACYSSFSALCTYNFPAEKNVNSRKYQPVVAITFTSVLGVVYLLYCVIQVMYLFMRIDTGLPVEETYSSYARSGFWELLFVSVINFVMVLLCMYLFKENKALKIILTFISICTFIMMGSAVYRMIMYVSQYHLTFLRVLVLWFFLVLAFIMVGTMISIYKSSFPLFRYIVFVVAVGYILFALVRPNYWVARYNVAYTKNMTTMELDYLMRDLGEDATTVIATINPDSIDTFAYYYGRFVDSEDVRGGMYSYFEEIADRNQGIYFRKANYTRIRAKQAAEKYLEEHKADRPSRYEDDVY